ncbi:MAG: archaetidylserine decarboxylase, partial [Salinisphaeraceae bacterium]|nr:archaetidylserine decarboxylase [Salinisphaeraceae bacterium]
MTQHKSASLGDRLFALLQIILPTHLLSRVVHWATRVETAWFKNLLINRFMAGFKISLDEYQVQNPRSFKSFNEFFTRALIDGMRPLPSNPDLAACPVDGTLYQSGRIEAGRIFQAKGKSFDVVSLLGGSAERAAPFMGGQFATIYLAPSNYHRIHMPMAGRLYKQVYVPGRLFSVNPATARAVDELFARNERVAALFETEIGPVAMVLVGALFVGSIETVWSGEVTPPHRRKVAVENFSHDDNAPSFERGD